jgi:hypothetical protein
MWSDSISSEHAAASNALRVFRPAENTVATHMLESASVDA